jgi:hypothetical protein
MTDEKSGKSFELTNPYIISNNFSGYIVQFHVNINLNIFHADIAHTCTCASGFETPTEDFQYLLQCWHAA